MKYTGLLLIAFGTMNIIFPDAIAYILWGVCVFIGTGMLLGNIVSPNKKHKDSYVKFGNYKIFR